MPLPDQCDDVYIGLYAVLTLVGQTDGQTDRRTSLTKQYRALHALHADAREKARARVFCYARICYILQKDHCNTVRFYVGAIAVIWAIMWFFLVYNSPDTHPRISREERQYIEKTLNKKTGAKVENTLFSGTFTRTLFARFVVICDTQWSHNGGNNLQPRFLIYHRAQLSVRCIQSS